MVLGGMRGWQRRNWRDRSKAERVELQSVFTWGATIWVFELTWLGLPVVGSVRHRPVPLVLCGLLLAVGVLQCVAANRLARPSLDHYLGRAVLPPRALRGSLVLLALALVLPVVLTLVGGIAPWTARLAIGAALLTFGLTYGLLVPVSVLVRRSALLAAVLMAVAALAFRSVPDVLMTGFLVVFAMGMSLLAARCGAWTLSVLWEAERARETEARLAVAEERLRFGRDLHDVLGRNLAVIALKAELAVQLGRRGRPEAVDQMVEVQRLAQESQREVRAVVRGYREADLAAELAGAQGVLGAAGIHCAITGSAAGLPAAVQSALAWVVREATTNVLRHGDARSCAIALRIDAGRAGLSVENDGAPRSPGGTPGSGLAGLRERLSELDGTLCAGPVDGGRFRLTAEVPLRPAGGAATGAARVAGGAAGAAATAGAAVTNETAATAGAAAPTKAAATTETAATPEAAATTETATTRIAAGVATTEAAATAEAATTTETAATAEVATTTEVAAVDEVATAEAASTAVTVEITRASSEVTP